MVLVLTTKVSFNRLSTLDNNQLEDLPKEIFMNNTNLRLLGANWKAIAHNLMAIEKPKFTVDARAVREKYAYLAGKLRNELKEEEKASGIATKMTEVEEAFQETIEIEDKAERALKDGSNEKKNESADRAQAETMRKRAMESLGESLGKKGDDAENGNKKQKRRSNGSDTLMFLKEKSEMMHEMKKQEMELKKKEIELQDKKHDDFLRVMLAQQQQLQQQQQDFQAMMLAMMNKLTQK
ncbi:hypothetical protein AWC38_SpisGene20443 [Stylophora pistillata]|uniref:Uncharacterized protein n=1 Tax=Stylophora pistillata TaxID=50429 RepID=A0A2B4RGF6_STYPI|nr:hypothetical protein AWC38_SpisGene20443 [Stylophora pistillata]